jgi:hypothetical protein
MRILGAILGLASLSACATYDVGFDPDSLTWENYLLSAERDFDEAYRDIPFERGQVDVVANEHGDLHTYSLTPCGGAHICGGSGGVGRVTRTPDFFVVTGAYRDRTFYLSPGGDGILTWRGVNRDLAWN